MVEDNAGYKMYEGLQGSCREQKVTLTKLLKRNWEYKVYKAFHILPLAFIKLSKVFNLILIL